MAPTFLSPAQISPLNSRHIFNCLLIISAQVTNCAFQLCLLAILPCSVNGNSIFSDGWIQNHAVIHDLSLSYIPSIPSASSSGVLSSKAIPDQIIFHHIHCYHLMQINIISHLDSCCSLLSSLLGPGLSPFSVSLFLTQADTLIC